MNDFDYIVLYCGPCQEFVTVKRDRVVVTLNLMVNLYIFETECPDCGMRISSTRDSSE